MNRTLRPLLAAALFAGLLPAASTADERYGYVRTLEGGASIASAGDSAQSAETNQPIMAGDRIEVSSRSRIELELSDRNLVRLGGDSDLTLERSAYSADSQDRSTLLRLDQGDLQLVVTDEALGDELPRIDTANATLYVGEPGLYRVTTDGGEWTEITVREGSLEVRTDTDSQTLQAGDAIRVEGAEFPQISELSAPGEDEFDRWGGELDGEVAQADLRYVEPEMRYTTASLGRYGSWVNVGSRYAWRPRSVDSSWRPYWDGRWIYTPSGLTWVSNEPWGWATYHYGSWDYAPSYGWVWYPGTQYSPAWVYWYWGPSYAAWCPSGYYNRYRSGYGWNDLRIGVYGWAGGGWDGFLNWNFIPTRYFGRRDQRSYCHPGSYFRDRYGLGDVARGIITTDTRPITPDRWGRSQDVIDALRRVPFDTRPGGRDINDLPDVSGFVNRRADLDPQVRNRIAALPPVTDVAVARRIPSDPRTGARRTPTADGGMTTIVAPRNQPPRTSGGPRLALPREEAQPAARDRQGWRSGGESQPRTIVTPRVAPRPSDPQPRSGDPRAWRIATPHPGQPTGQPSPRVMVPRDGQPAWRNATPRPGQPTVQSAPRVVVPRGGQPAWRSNDVPRAQPTVEPRQGWRDGRGPSRTYVPYERGGSPNSPRAEAPRRIYAQPGTRPSGERPSDAPVVRRVIDGVRNATPRPTPYVSPAPRYQPRPTPQAGPAPRYQPQPDRRPTPAPTVRSGDSNGRSRSQDAPRASRGQERRTEDRKPPKRDRDH